MFKFEINNPNWQLGAFALFALGLHWYSVEQHEDEVQQIRAECMAQAAEPMTIAATTQQES